MLGSGLGAPLQIPLPLSPFPHYNIPGSPWAVLTTGCIYNTKHLKNVGPIRHNEPPHANSPDVASGTVARRLRIDVHDNDDDDNDNA